MKNQTTTITTSFAGKPIFSFIGKLKSAAILLFFLSGPVFAQSPNQFSFQGAARNAEGKVVASKTVSLKITIRYASIQGQPVYEELHQTMTNSGGIFNVQIGGGDVQSGVFSSIDWKSDKYFLQIEMDPEGGNNMVDLGTTQLLSVPYAQFAQESGQWQNGYPVVQKMAIGSDIDMNDPNAPNDPDLQKYLLPTIGDGDRMIWYPFKGAFRAGLSQNGRWEKDQLGTNSVAFGGNTLAKGSFSTAFGNGTQATGDFSTSIGLNSNAQGGASTAIGWGAIAFGYGTTSIGHNTYANTNGSVALGLYNDASDNPNDANPMLTDRIFQVGNGNGSERSNAVTVLRNGFTGLGQDAKTPQFQLDVAGRARIQHNGETAGIYFNNSANATAGFIGMVNDNEVGLFVGNGWKFYVNGNGNATLAGTLAQNSDRRLKRNLSPLTSSLIKINGLQGYYYFWKDAQKDQSLQTGLIAQEVEAGFPELVSTDGEGYKSVNYLGLIPHLIESIKDLKAEIEMLKKDKQ